MAVIKLNDNPSDRDLRQFAAIWFPLFWAVVAGMAYYTAGSLRVAAAALTVGLVVGGIGMTRVGFIRPIFLGWMYAAYPIGWVVSHLLLGAIFYLLMTPIGWAMRLVGYDPLQRRMDRSAKTFWVPVEPAADQTSYFRQF